LGDRKLRHFWLAEIELYGLLDNLTIAITIMSLWKKNDKQGELASGILRCKSSKEEAKPLKYPSTVLMVATSTNLKQSLHF
jgi:hypothetical protein